jgi:hypothetical protein
MPDIIVGQYLEFSKSWTTLCNMALARMGSELITDLQDGSQNSLYCQTFLDDAIQIVLNDYSWLNCRRRVVLGPDVEKPPFRWRNYFTVPDGYIRHISILDSGGYAVPFIREGNKILSDADELNLVYIYKPYNPNDIGPHVRVAIYTRLAYLISTAISSNETLLQVLIAEYEAALEKAKVQDNLQTYKQEERYQ